MEVFEKVITVSEDDLDQLNHVNNVRYVQWIQDIAEAHWLKKAHQIHLDTFFWVLISHHIQYKNQAVLGDQLHLKTFVNSSDGVKSIRQVEITNHLTKKPIVNSETVWCFMDKKTMRPTRITDKISNLFI